MIYTVTLNPAIDCAMAVSGIAHGRVNRAESQAIRFGGKGINVSYVLKEFGGDSILTGFAAGFTGDALTAGLTAEGFTCDFVKLSRGTTRINVKLTASDDCGDPDTEINAPGPCTTADEIAALTAKLKGLRPGDAVVLAGSLPRGVSADLVKDIADAVPDGVAFVCDLTGEALTSALYRNPAFVKPNVHELFEFLGTTAEPGISAVADGAARLISMGAASVLVTMGSEGAYFVTAEGDHGFVPAPTPPRSRGGEGSAVGCGDSAVAGWLMGMGYAGDAVRARALDAAEISGVSEAEAAARLAVMLGSGSYYFGFPASPDKVIGMR